MSRSKVELNYPPNSATDYTGFMSSGEWYQYWIEGIDNGIMDRPAVLYYTMGDVDDPGGPGNEWKWSDVWPPSSLHPCRSTCTTDCSSEAFPADDAPADSYLYDPLDPVPTVGGANLTIPAGPFDQSALESVPTSWSTRLPCSRSRSRSRGRIVARLWASSDAPDTDWTVKLTDVYPDGRSMLLLDGILRARHRESMETEVFMEPGEVYLFEVDIWSTSIVFNVGHRIRIAISSSNDPRFDPNPNTGHPFRADERDASRFQHDPASCGVEPVVRAASGGQGDERRLRNAQRSRAHSVAAKIAGGAVLIHLGRGRRATVASRPGASTGRRILRTGPTSRPTSSRRLLPPLSRETPRFGTTSSPRPGRTACPVQRATSSALRSPKLRRRGRCERRPVAEGLRSPYNAASMPPVLTTARVVENTCPSPSYFLLRLRLDEAEGCNGRPGQFAMVRGHWGNDPIGPRAFSLMGRNDVHEVSLLGRVVGAGTERLARVRPGEHLSYLGPLGNPFPTPRSADGPLLLVAGGVGLPPIHFLLEELSRSPELSARTKVLYGGRSSADILLRSELERSDLSHLRHRGWQPRDVGTRHRCPGARTLGRMRPLRVRNLRLWARGHAQGRRRPVAGSPAQGLGLHGSADGLRHRCLSRLRYPHNG